MIFKDYLIAIDLDGTLIANFDEADKKSLRYLKKLAKTNTVVIATGRPLRSSKYYYNLMKLKTPIINYNGALIQNPYDQSFPKYSIKIDKALLINFVIDNNDIIHTLFCEIDDDIYLDRNFDYAYPYLHTEGGNLITGSISKTLLDDPNGAVVFAKAGSEERLIKYAQANFNEKIKIRIWHTKDIVIAELHNPLINKGNALKKVCDYYSIAHDKTIAIGDGNNDLEMIKFAKYGVAMANAVPELIEIANYKTKSIDENGVFHFLKNFKDFQK